MNELILKIAVSENIILGNTFCEDYLRDFVS